jgi:nucleolysin TIA-1/TIAR
MMTQLTESSTTPPLAANAALGGREVNKRVLYIGGVDHNVTEEILLELFKTIGDVVSIKILPDKNRKPFNYAFVEYAENTSAEAALDALNGRVLNNSTIRINWAYHSQQAIKDSEFFNIFVGDLSSEVDDEQLSETFMPFGSMIEARVMWDMTTGRSRGYGFVSFRQSIDAENAIRAMDGQFVGSRMIRCNWAAQRPSQHRMPLGMINAASYEMVLHQSANWQTTVYIGNLAPNTSQLELIPLLQNFGYIVEFKYQPERGYAFVRFDSHERAAMAIVQLTGYQLNGRIMRCGWGRTRHYSNTQSGHPFA